jgi:Rps23 Pro-64 3,4-dihydroxylase Tpa1-like proline 4-hydroxylase
MLNSYSQVVETVPFPHFTLSSAFDPRFSVEILSWLERQAPWRLKVASFYEQYEFSFHDVKLPRNISETFNANALAILKKDIERSFAASLDDRIDITAHKLVAGQRIRIHNDYIPGQESHRILIQLNRGWAQEHGGILMFFKSENHQDLHSAFLPAHNTSVAFEISPASLHAVSEINSGERYTIVMSFYRK